MSIEEKTRLVPKLRFPEFRGAEEWSSATLGEKSTILKGKGISKADLDPSGQQLCIRYGELYTRYGEVITKVASRTKVPTSELFLSKSNDVIVPSSGETKIDIAKASCVLDAEVALGGDLNVIRSKLNGTFLSYLLNGPKKLDIAKVAQGDSVVHLYPHQLESLSIAIPASTEQQKIADCLSSLDELIAAQARKVDALKTHKKGLMQQLFPREGETQPRLRFPEFRDAGEWESKTLIDACKMQAGKFVAAADIKEEKTGDLFPCYGGNGLRGFTVTHTHDGLFPLIGRQGALCGNVKLASGQFHATEHAVVATPNQGVDVVWLYYLLDLLNLNRFATGQAQPGLSVDVLEKLPVTIPKDECEQKRIAKCLRYLDDFITAAAQELDILKTHKKGFDAPAVSEDGEFHMTLDEIAKSLRDDPARITLAYAFNATGKTQLSVAYKNASKLDDGTHTGVYYNAYSEDLFVWDNDNENNGANIQLTVLPSSLSKFHSLMTEDDVREKLNAYKPKFGFAFNPHEDDPEKGIASISFFIPNQNPDLPQPPIKISRGEERIFVWCFFLALFEVEGWADKQSSHFFIDDPVSSLDDHNIFITAATLFDLIESQFEKRKIIVTTHHLGLFSILSDWLTKGEKSDKFKKKNQPLYKLHIMSMKSGELELESCRKDVFLYHLRLMQILSLARKANDIRAHHFALLRQVLENVASFLGVGQFGYVLNQIGITEPNRVADIVNALSHKKVYYYESDDVVPDNLKIFNEVLDRLREKYSFVLHEGGA